MTDETFDNLVDELGRLPGIGPKSAQRIAYFILRNDEASAQRLADAIMDRLVSNATHIELKGESMRRRKKK